MDTNQKHQKAVEIEYYTDPLCGWSWAMEPVWRQLRYNYGDQVNWKYRMSGVMPDQPDPNTHLKPLSPGQMSEAWKKACQKSRMPAKDKLWDKNPPRSSYPACLAVKTVEQQSEYAAEKYLRKLREAFVMNGRDIAQVDVLLDIGRDLAQEQPDSLDYERFKNDMMEKSALVDFQDDVDEARMMCLSRFPTLVIKNGEHSTVLTGFHSYAEVENALKEVHPDLQPVQNSDSFAYKEFWGDSLPEELEEVEMTANQKSQHYANSVAS